MRVTVSGGEPWSGWIRTRLSTRGILALDQDAPFAENADYKIRVEATLGGDEKAVVIDGVECELERRTMNWITRLLEQASTGVSVRLSREGGVRSDRELRIQFSVGGDARDVSREVELGVCSALEEILRANPPTRWQRFKEVFK